MNTQTMEQGPAPSIEERAGKAFSNFMGFNEPKKQQPPVQQQQQQQTEAQPEQAEPQPEAASADAPAPEEFFEFEVEGTTYQLPKALEKAVLQERDYTQKSQKNAERAKALEMREQQLRTAAMRSEFEREVAAEAQQLSAYDSVLAQANQINWSQMSTDEILRKKLEIDSWKEQREAIARGLEAKYQQFNAKREESLKDLRAKALEMTTQRIPNWNEVKKAVRDHAISEGISEAELEASEFDPRHNLILWQAYQYSQLKKQATKAVGDVRAVKTTSANPMPQSVKDKFAFNKAIQKTAPGSQEHKRLVEQRVGSLFAKR
jgi:hypothetical protein